MIGHYTLGSGYMVEVIEGGAYLFDGRELVADRPENAAVLAKRLAPNREAAHKLARQGTISYGILAAHNQGPDDGARGSAPTLKLKFDALASHDITFVNIIQTAKGCGLEKFPVPYILTNCHNSLCAVGGTINEDDHVFGLSAAEKYGGIYVPPHLAVIHSYIRETQAGCGKMILGSDSHTRYGALGTLGVGEGGGELVKQLLSRTYDIAYPKVIGVCLSGKVRNGVGPQDVALAIIGAVFKSGFAKNAILEFVGDGVATLSADFRCGIDVMTTETTCWSSIWETDDRIRDFLALHGRAACYKPLRPAAIAYYDGMIRVDLSTVKPMIALPFHPSNTFEIDALLANPGDILRKVEQDAAAIMENPKIRFTLTDKVDAQGRIRIDQGIIAGCAGGTYENIMAAASLLEGGGSSISDGRNTAGSNSGPSVQASPFSLSVYPGSQSVMLELAKNGCMGRLIAAGAIVRTAFCGPCFGAGDVPANNGLSIRHTTRNFPNREGSRPADGQIASVALMDARSIAATAANGGYLASAEYLEGAAPPPAYHYDESPYRNRVYTGTGFPKPTVSLRYGPNITDWPDMADLGEHLLVQIVSFITDPVTTTDEIIPSGETSSYRSNPIGLAEFTLSRKDPAYVGRAKLVRQAELARQELVRNGGAQSASTGTLSDFPEFPSLPEIREVISHIRTIKGMERFDLRDTRIGSAIYAVKPGDGSAREQAASCQRILGGAANFAREYATKRYRSNLVNWGILPFILDGEPVFKNGDYIFIPQIASALKEGRAAVQAYLVSPNTNQAAVSDFTLRVPELTAEEKEIVLAGSLINYNRRTG
ncbi:hydratase [Spirochaetia bacterium]|nr:hydratase [Spirochaetia bacterium]